MRSSCESFYLVPCWPLEEILLQIEVRERSQMKLNWEIYMSPYTLFSPSWGMCDALEWIPCWLLIQGNCLSTKKKHMDVRSI